MSARIGTPVNQKRHSNVAIVRYMKYGKKLEIACYKNKVIAYREGIEVRMDEVLQSDRVFVNVDKGEFASVAHIRTVLPGKDAETGKEHTEETALKFVLEHGEFQVSAAEREHQLEETFKSACTIAASRCVHPVTNRPYSVAIIEDASKRIGFSLGGSAKNANNAKSLALRLMKDLIAAQIIPIRRAATRVRMGLMTKGSSDSSGGSPPNVDASDASQQAEVEEAARRFLTSVEAVILAESQLSGSGSTSSGGTGGSSGSPVEEKETNRQLVCNNGEFRVFLVDMDPEHFRHVNEWCTANGNSVAVIDYAVADTSDGSAEDFVLAADVTASAPPPPPLPLAPTPAANATEAKSAAAEGKPKNNKNNNDASVSFDEQELDTLANELETLRREADDQDSEKKGKAKKKDKKAAAAAAASDATTGSATAAVPKKKKKKADDEDSEEEGFDDDEEKEVKKVEYTLVDITDPDAIASLLDDDGETREDLFLPGHGPDETMDDATKALSADIRKAFDDGEEVIAIVYDDIRIGAFKIGES